MSFEPGALVADGSIPLCVPELRGNEWKYVQECLDSNWVSSAGPFVDQFEKSLASYVGAKRGIAVVNGTAALQIALLISGVEPDDEVLVPALTFIAPVNAVSYAGAHPVFIDVEPHHWQIDPQKISDFLHQKCHWINGELRNTATGRRVKAILPVHVLGHPCEMDTILELSRKFELRVIEDATESLGSKYQQRNVGNLGEISCFSFNGNKIITTGGGGMIVTDNDAWADRVRYLTTQAKDDPIEYFHAEIGYNYRLTNIQAALGCAQMEQLDDHVASKRRIATTYQRGIEDIAGLEFYEASDKSFCTYWLSTIMVDEATFGIDSRSIMKALSSEGIQSRPVWHPINSLPPYKHCESYKVEVATHIYKHALSLPSSTSLTDSDQARVLSAIRRLAN